MSKVSLCGPPALTLTAPGLYSNFPTLLPTLPTPDATPVDEMHRRTLPHSPPRIPVDNRRHLRRAGQEGEGTKVRILIRGYRTISSGIRRPVRKRARVTSNKFTVRFELRLKQIPTPPGIRRSPRRIQLALPHLSISLRALPPS